MFALGLRYLNGFVVAAEPGSRETAEWPPHPGRVFMALAAAHFQTGADTVERAALLWLESLEPPAVRAGEAVERKADSGGPVTRHVPVNDKVGPAKALLQSAPIARDRQPRTFAQAWLTDDVVYFVWPQAAVSEAHHHALRGLSEKVTRVGHSSSFVHIWIAKPEEVGEMTWIPDGQRAALQLRVVGPGALEDLERRYNKMAVDTYSELVVEAAEANGSPRAGGKRLERRFGGPPPVRLRPSLSRYQGYARLADQESEPSGAATVFSPYFIVRNFDETHSALRGWDLSCVLALTKRWRNALLSQSNDLSEKTLQLIGGHDSTGAPMKGPHMAFLPLAFVGHPHADGHLLGMGITLPRKVEPVIRQEVLTALARVQSVALGRLGVVRVGAVTASAPPWNLQAAAWTAYPAGATHWSTITPIVFDRHPKTKDRSAYQREVGLMIAEACRHLELPSPKAVAVTPISAHSGVPSAYAFPKLRRKDNSERRHTHAILIFDEPVCGPILLGAGRYLGYGSCRPLVGVEGGSL
jgi:CRISPR-associated protein Csb2